MPSVISLQRRLLSASTLVSLVSLAITAGAQAGGLPTGGHFIAGHGGIGKAGRSLTVKQSSTTGIIDWSKFSVAKHDGVTFDNGSGATLNRVTGTSLSTVAGSLHATGSLYLINARGVIVSGTGKVVTGGNFVASSGPVLGNAFGNDPLRFGTKKARVINRGTIVSADGATLAGSHVADSGTIHAAQIDLKAGKTLKIGGAVGAQNGDGSGGTIVATARHIEVSGTAAISADGTRGGTILIGGDIHGGAIASDNFVQRTVTTAQTTKIEKGARIGADASQGAGGNIVIWSDGHTSFQGRISATGATAGGFAEVSSHNLLGFGGGVDLMSADGSAGTLLLDPYNVTISNGATKHGAISGGVFKPSGDSSVLKVSTLESALAKANVEITTGSSGKQAGNITVASAIAWSSGKKLSLEAFHSIAVDAAITSTGSGSLVLRADATGNGVGTVSFGKNGKLNFAKSKGTIGIYYNPADNPAGSAVNTTSYTAPTSFSKNIKTNSAVKNQAVAYMLVNTVFDLQNIQNNSTGDYALGRDISATATDKWNPGTSGGQTVYGGFLPIDYSGATEFTGILNGLGHKVTGLYESWTGDAFGLFGYVGTAGIIENLSLANVSFNFGPTSTFGGVVVGDNFGLVSNVSASGKLTSQVDGSAGGLVAQNESTGTITGSHSSVTVSYTGALGEGGTDYGGLVGQSFGTITNSHATGAVTDEAANANVGGLVGFNNGSEGVAFIDKTYATGTVTGGTSALGGGSNVGGLIGYNLGAASTKKSLSDALAAIGTDTPPPAGTVILSYATGAVIDKGHYEYIGGLVGFNDQNGLISVDYATGKVTAGADALVGGLVGSNNALVVGDYESGAVTAGVGGEVGGLVGLNSGIGIAGCWALGNVTAGDADDSDNPRVADAGGLVGRNQTQVVESFAMGNVKVGASTNVSEGATAQAGGLVGVDYGGTLDQVYSTGMVSGGKGATVGGLSGGSGEGVTAGFWDTQTSGVKKSQEGSGLTTAQLQAALPSGFDKTVWAILPKTSFPYLDLQTDSFKTQKSTGTPIVISGTISGQSQNSGILVEVRVNGKTVIPLSFSSSGANGYYYELLSGKTLSKSGSDVLVYTVSGKHANTFKQLAKGSLTNFNLVANSLIVDASATSETSLLTALEKGLGSNFSDALYTVGGNFTSGISLDLNLSGASFAIDHAIDLGTGALQIDAAGTITQASADGIKAKTLKGKSGGAAQFGSAKNTIADLHGFSTGGHLFALTDDQDLAVNGAVTSGASATDLTTVGKGHDIAIDAAVKSSTDVNLVSAGNVTESNSGAISAAVLNVTAGTGITLTSKLNKIVKLGTDKTKSGPNKVTL